MLPKYSCICGFPLKDDWLTRGCTLRKKILVLPKASWLGWDFTSNAISMLGFVLAWVCMYFVHSVINTVNSYMQLCLEGSFLVAIPHLCSLHSFFPFSHNNPLSLGRRKCSICVLFRAEHSEVSYSLSLGQLWISVLITIYCKQKLLWWELRDTLTLWVKCYVIQSLILCLSRIVVVGFLLGPMTCLA